MKPWEKYSDTAIKTPEKTSTKPWENYSKPDLYNKPETIKTDKSTVMNVDTVENNGDFYVSDESQRLKWASQGPMGWWEYGQRTKFSDIYYGPILGVSSLKGMTDRLQANEYETEEAKEKDMKALRDVMLWKEEAKVRGMSWGAQTYKVVGQIPSFALEMLITSPLAAGVRKALTPVKAAATQVTKKALIRKGAEILGREAVVGLARTTVMPHRYNSKFNERRLNDVISITDKGIDIADEAQEKPATAFLKAYGDVFVEYYSETLGGELFKPIGKVAGKGILSRMPKAARKSFEKMAKAISDKMPKGEITRLFTKGGFDGIIEEYGEERVGGLLRVLLGLDEREIPTIDKLQQAIFPGWEQASIEIGAFAIWGGLSSSGQVITNYLNSKGKRQEEIDKILDNLSQKEKDSFATKLGETFDERVTNAQVVIKAAGGADLSQGEKAILDRIHSNFKEQGFIEEKPSEAEKEAKKGISEPKTGIVEEEIIATGPQAQKAQDIIAANEKQAVDIEKKIKLLYQGREAQLDQKLAAVEKEMSLLEKNRDMRIKQGLPVKEIENQLAKLDKEFDSLHYQIADLEDTASARLEKEGITIKGQELEQLRKKAFKRGEITLRKDLLSKIRAEKLEKKKREKLKRQVLKQPKKPAGVIDLKYQKEIQNILDKLGEKKQIRKKTLDKMTTEELTDLADYVSSLKETGKKVFATKKAQRNMASEILRASLIQAAGGMPDGTFAKGSVEERKAKRASGIKKADIAFTRPLEGIQRFFGDTGEKLIYDTIDHADTIKNVNSLARKVDIDKVMKKNKVTLFDLGSVITINDKSYQVNNILRMYLATKDKKSYDALLFGNRLTESEVNDFIERVKKDFPSYIKFADDVQKIVAKKYEAIAKVMAEYYNIEVDKVKQYFPLRRIALGQNQEELNESIESEMVFEQALRKGEGFVYTSADKGFTISRKDINEKFQTEISLDFLGDAYRAIDKQEHLISHAPLQKSFNKIINDPALQEAIKYNHSEAAWKWLNDYLTTNINPDIMYQGGNQYGRLLSKARLGLTKAYLSFNAVTAAKQLPSFSLALKYTTPKELTVSMERIAFSEKARNKIYELDPSLKNRVISRDFADLMKVTNNLPESDIKRRLLLTSKSIDKAGFAMIMQMDKYAVLSVYDSVYRHQLKTKSEMEARDIAHKAVIKTQPQGGVKDLPAIYRTNNEFIRMTLMFSNQLNQIWNMIRADLPEEVAKKEYAKAATGIASIIFSSTMIYIMSNGRLPEDFDDLIDAIFGNVVASVPILGQWGMSMVRGYDPSISPATSLTNNTKWMISNLKNEEYGKAFTQSLFLLATWLKLPYAQPKRTITGIKDLITGETEDFRRLIWSEYSLENK